ncbi:uncharacterized protein LOC105281798 isoform X2 [Ooceraea biroi]|uniref:uncharacterized protein LOC105281798 isoform X2 n=1 Tax=Ooceraea biroi TaxID=2015173 RepID=UPI0009715BE9|nr:uncharacterized protein LOC105281798 isoform X2 [Ooceraea biroi]
MKKENIFNTLSISLAKANFQTKINVALALTEEDLKDQLMVTIIEAKNRAFELVQGIRALAANKPEKFIGTVDQMVQNSLNDMETLKKQSGTVNDVSCNEKSNIEDAALKTISQYQTCIEKVIDSADADLSYLASDGNLLMKEIQYAKSINEELRKQVLDIEARSYKFGKYVQKLEKCDTQSNLVRLTRQISEALARYKQCLQK